LALLDLVEGNGPMAVADMAKVLDCAVDGLYYHLNIMTRSGWFVCATATAINGRSKAVYDLADRNYRIEYNPKDTRNRVAVIRVITALLRDSLREFRRAYAGKPVIWGPPDYTAGWLLR
jgi:predicted ArsR family transcriptional regulator